MDTSALTEESVVDANSLTEKTRVDANALTRHLEEVFHGLDLKAVENHLKSLKDDPTQFRRSCLMGPDRTQVNMRGE